MDIALVDKLRSCLDEALAGEPGEVVVGASPAARTIATGDTMNTAARLQQAAPVGEILIGARTHRLVHESVIAKEVEPLSVSAPKVTASATVYAVFSIQ